MNAPAPRKISLWRTVKAVAWSFIGLRAQGAYEEDIKSLNPLTIIAVAFVGVLLFVGALIALVNWVVPRLAQ